MPKNIPMQPDRCIRSSNSSSLAISRLACVSHHFFSGIIASQQFFYVFAVYGQVIVPEPYDLPLPPMRKIVVLNIADHVGHRAEPKTGIKGWHGTKRALERAAAGSPNDARNK